MAGSIGCDGLGVSGGIDSVIRISQQPISEDVDFAQDPNPIIETLSESVTVLVTP